jgi:hypothetical protein
MTHFLLFFFLALRARAVPGGVVRPPLDRPAGGLLSVVLDSFDAAPRPRRLVFFAEGVLDFDFRKRELRDGKSFSVGVSFSMFCESFLLLPAVVLPLRVESLPVDLFFDFSKGLLPTPPSVLEPVFLPDFPPFAFLDDSELVGTTTWGCSLPGPYKVLVI